MSEVAGDHVVNVASVKSVHREREVVHKRKHVVGGPDQVEPVKQGVQTHNSIPNVPLRQSVQQVLQISIEITVEEPLRSAVKHILLLGSRQDLQSLEFRRTQLGRQLAGHLSLTLLSGELVLHEHHFGDTLGLVVLLRKFLLEGGAEHI